MKLHSRVFQTRYCFVALAAVGAMHLADCPPIRTLPPSIDVSGRVQGVDGTGQAVTDFVLSLRHTQPAPEPHLAYRRSGMQDVRRIALAATASTGLPFNEEWHFIHLSRDAQRPGAEPVLLEFSGEPGWVSDHVGDLAWLVIRKNDVSLPSDSFSNFPPASLRSAGATILARVETDDPVLPWTRATCSEPEAMPLSATLRSLAPPGQTDCFDMQSLTSALLNNIAVTVADAAQVNNARVTLHRMAIVPHVPSTPAGRDAPLPGIGFVYQAALEPTVGGEGVGSFTGPLMVSVPLTLHWARDAIANGRLVVMLDPINAFVGQSRVNANRVTVHANDGTIAAAVAQSLRQTVSDAIAAARLPTGPAGIPLTSFLELLFTESLVRPTGGLPANFSLLAVPENRTVSGAPQNIAMTMGPIAITTVTPLTPLPGGLDALTVVTGAGGAVSVLRNLNAAGTRVRRFDLPAPLEPLPFSLILLK
jgi:hypothetical protein